MTQPPAAATATERLGRALDSLVRLSASRKLHSRQAAAAGAAVSQQGFRLLRLIVETGGSTPTQLAQRTDMDPAVVTRQTRLLEADGLIERQRDGSDGRLSSLTATATGCQTVDRMGRVLDGHMRLALEGWRPGDVETLAELMGRLVDDLRTIPYPGI